MQDLSLFGLFIHAHFFVKLVMLALLGASLFSWSIIIEKISYFRTLMREIDSFEETFWSGKTLEELYELYSAYQSHGLASLFLAAMKEWRRSFEGKSYHVRSLSARIDRVLVLAMRKENEKMRTRLVFLASIGSSAPYVGLLGTVWGIMSAFTSISATQSMSLGTVAPGIAEALMATALGLCAAIPAIFAFNKFQVDIVKVQTRLVNFSDEFATMLSRQIDEYLPENYR